MRYKLTLEYDGSAYQGWQCQAHGPSIQEAIEDALERFCGVRAEVVGAGRTDAGVHAKGQVAHVDLPREHDPYRVMMGVNFHLHTALPRHVVSITHAEAVEDNFHARFSATGRTYLYRILNRRAPPALEAGRVWHVVEPLDADAMRNAAGLLIGQHDFTSFRDSQCQAKSAAKTLRRLDVQRNGDEIHLHVEARSFLHHQVRIMAGSLKLVGNGKWRPEHIAQALAARDRKAAGPTAPPQGLYLVRVEYG